MSFENVLYLFLFEWFSIRTKNVRLCEIKWPQGPIYRPWKIPFFYIKQSGLEGKNV